MFIQFIVLKASNVSTSASEIDGHSSQLGMASTRLKAFARNLYSLIGSPAIVLVIGKLFVIYMLLVR